MTLNINIPGVEKRFYSSTVQLLKKKKNVPSKNDYHDRGLISTKNCNWNAATVHDIAIAWPQYTLNTMPALSNLNIYIKHTLIFTTILRHEFMYM